MLVLKSIISDAVINRLVVLDGLKKTSEALAIRARYLPVGARNDEIVAEYDAICDKFNRMKFFWMKKLPPI